MDRSNADSWARKEQRGKNRLSCGSQHSHGALSGLIGLHLKARSWRLPGGQETLPFHPVPEGGKEARHGQKECVAGAKEFIAHGLRDTPTWPANEFRELPSLCDPRQATFHLGLS